MREYKFRAWDGEKFTHFGLFHDEPLKYIEIHEYTGFEDREGKEVFEGDIVKIHSEVPHEVYTIYFASGGFMAGDMFLDDYWNMYGYMFEVVGNKFENPELLEVQDEKGD